MFKYCIVGVGVLGMMVASSSAQAQGHRSAWMWSASTHPYGTVNVVGDPVAEANLIQEFDVWGFDRIYASLNAIPVDRPEDVANWNARLHDAGMQSQSLFGENVWVLPGDDRNNLLNLVQTRIIDFNASRTDPRERFDAIHFDIEPHALSEWQNGTNTDRRDMLLMLRDTYADVRNLLDANGLTNIKIYADQPVWFDTGTNITWDPGEYDQWMDDISDTLDGLTLMAFERPTLSQIVSSVQNEFDLFEGECRIGLAANAVGPGLTWPTYQDLLDMSDALEAYYGSALGGIDYQPLIDWADLANQEPEIPVVIGDITHDGYVGLADLDVILNHWGQTVTPGSQPDPTGDGIVTLGDLDYVLRHWNDGVLMTPPTAMVVPEPTVASIILFAGLGFYGRRAICV